MNNVERHNLFLPWFLTSAGFEFPLKLSRKVSFILIIHFILSTQTIRTFDFRTQWQGWLLPPHSSPFHPIDFNIFYAYFLCIKLLSVDCHRLRYMEQVSFSGMGKHHINSVLMTKLITGVDQFTQVDDQLKRTFQHLVLNDNFINI